jgi:hypothetical protein
LPQDEAKELQVVHEQMVQCLTSFLSSQPSPNLIANEPVIPTSNSLALRLERAFSNFLSEMADAEGALESYEDEAGMAQEEVEGYEEGNEDADQVVSLSIQIAMSLFFQFFHFDFFLTMVSVLNLMFKKKRWAGCEKKSIKKIAQGENQKIKNNSKKGPFI